MFDFVQRNNRAVGIVLGVIALGLMVGVGVSGYDVASEPYLAKVAGHKITARDLAVEAEGQQIPEALQSMVLNQLIEKQLLLAEAKAHHLQISDEQLRKRIAEITAFQTDGKFDAQKYELMLQARNMTPLAFEAKVRDSLLTQSVMAALPASTFIGANQLAHMAALMGETRQVSRVVFKPEAQLAKVTVSDAEIKAYYDAHPAEFNVPERVRVEYLLLSADELASQQTVSDQAAQAYFEQNKDKLQKEERRVSHILLPLGEKASAADKTAVRAKAEQLLAELKKAPGRFAELAKQHSQDPGSASKGGDLGFFARGVMAKPFEDTAFKLKKDELSGIVETQFGLHILKLADIKAANFATMKADIVALLQKQQAGQRFQKASEQFSELVYQQADSLKPTADALKLTIRQSGWISRDKAEEAALNNDKLREALFGDDVLLKKHNSEAVELASGVLIAARVVEHQPKRLQPLESVKSGVLGKLKLERAKQQAEAAGKAALAALQKGPAPTLQWMPAQGLSRSKPGDFTPAAVAAIFQIAQGKLPAYTALPAADGYTLYRLDSVSAADAGQDKAALRSELEQARAQAEMMAYLASLRQKHGVELAQH